MTVMVSGFSILNDQVRFKKDIPFVGHTVASLGSFAMARYNGVGYIVAYGIDHRLYAYNATTNARIWQSVVLQANGVNSHVNIADFNNDGIPEVYCGNQIFSLPTGALLCSGGNNNRGAFRGDIAATNDAGCSTMAADMTGDGKLELFAGTQIYQIDIPQGATTVGSGTMTVMNDMELPVTSLPANAHQDGMTVVADIDNDGKLEVVVISRIVVGANARAVAYVWKPLPGNASHLLGSYLIPAMNGANSIPMIGKIDDCPYPEIVFITNGQNPIGTNYWYMYALRYEPSNVLGSRILLKWMMPHTDGSSGCTGMTLFDFNLDGVNEIVYRDETQLRIIDGSTTTPVARAIFNDVLSGTLRELPVIADVDGDGQAEIIIQGFDGVARTVEGLVASSQNGYLRVFKSNGSRWAPTRNVWNQYNYNAVNINNDLTVPQYQLNPATLFAGPDSILGTSDDIRPYNGFLVQQTLIDKYGIPVWLAPDLTFVQSTSSIELDGDSILFSLTVSNIGESSIGPPIHYTLYKESIPTGYVLNDSIQIQLNATGTTTFSFKVANASIQPALKVFIRLNDKNGQYPFQPECDTTNNVIPFPLMRKEAFLNGSSLFENGKYGNPVSVLYTDTIKYELTAVNTGNTSATFLIIDTLPLYLTYVQNSINGGDYRWLDNATTPARLRWEITSLAAGASEVVSFEATPEPGVCISQPMFINKAYVTLVPVATYPTNETYHQGAGAGYVTFLASMGGSLFNADMQAVDYRMTPKSGIVVAPDEGYRFAGWSHDEYISLRGEKIPAQSGIMRYDTLKIYGHVTLRANFVPNESQIKTDDATLNEQPTAEVDQIWAAGNELFVRTSKTSGVVRIYSMDGVLQTQRIILQAGITKIQLPAGLYVVTLNDGVGKKVMVND